MKIIKPGSPPPPSPEPVFQGTCKNCGGVVECGKSDVFHTSNRGARFVKCPQEGCGECIAVTPYVTRGAMSTE